MLVKGVPGDRFDIKRRLGGIGIPVIKIPLYWRHKDHGGVSNHQPRGCLLNRLFRCRWKKTSKLRVTGLCAGNSPGPVNSPHKGPVTRKMFPFDDVIMTTVSQPPHLYSGISYIESSPVRWNDGCMQWMDHFQPEYNLRDKSLLELSRFRY